MPNNIKRFLRGTIGFCSAIVIVMCAAINSNLSNPKLRPTFKSRLEKNKIWLDFFAAVGICGAMIVAIWAVLDASASSSKQYSIMQGQLQEMQLENRPWIGPRSAKGTINYDKEHNVAVDVTALLANAGKSPAFIKEVKAAITLYNTFPADPDYPVKPRSGKSMTVPGGEIYIPVSGAKKLDEDAVKQINSQQSKWYVYGEVVYGDAARDDKYLTHFCWMAVPSGNETLTVICPSYNDAK